LISLTYAAAATTWVVVTDWGLELLVNPAHSLGWSIGKGLLFVAVTTLVLFLSLRTQTGASRPLKDEAQKPRLDSDGSSVSTELDVTRRKRAGATVVESERRFRSLARNIPGVVFQLRVTAGKAYCFDYLSPKADEIFGVNPSLQGADWRDLGALVHPDDRSDFLASVNGAITRRADWEFEGRLAGPEDRPRWFQGLSSVLEDGDEMLFFGVILDITQRKRIEEQLRKLSLAVEHSPVSVVITDRQGSIEYVNPRFAELTGYTLEEARGQNPRILKSGYTSDDVYRRMWESITSGQLWHGEFQNKKKNGELYWESASISPVLNEQGAVTHFVAVKENITEQKGAELALSQSQERFQRALENIPDVVVIYDSNFKIQYVNAASRQLTGRPASDFIGRRDEEIWPAEVCEAYLPALRDAFQSRATRWLETDLSLPGRGQRNLRITYVPMTDDEGNVREVLGITQDLTESKAREREIERLNRLYATLCGLNQSIVRVKSREELFREVCRITVAFAGFEVVWVGWHDRETQEVCPVARAGDSAGYLDKIKVYADDRPEGGGPVGLCIRSAKPCIFDDFVHDPRTTPWRVAAIAHGLLSVAALPIQVNGEVCGAFVVYAGEKGVFQDKEVALLQEVAATISFALNHLEQEEKRQRAEDSLREREAQYRAVIETSADGFSMCDATGHFLELNDAYVRRSGYSRDELLNMRIPDVLAHEQWQDVEDGLAQIRRDGSALFESLHRSKDGTVWPGEVNVAYWPNAGGRFLSFVRDVHRRNRSEALLRTRLQLSDLASRASLDELLQTALDTAELYTGSRVGYLHFVDVEQQGLALEGRSTSSIGSTGPNEVSVQTLPISQAGAWADCCHTRVPVIHNDFSSRSQSGLPECSTPIVRYMSVPIIRNDQVTAILGVGNKASDYNQDDVQVLHELASMVMEIVERKQTEILMSLLVTALEASASAIVITRLDGVIEWANPAFSLLSGYSLEEAVGRKRGDLGGSGVQSRELTAALSETALGRRVWRGELINQRKDGSLYYEEMTMTPVADEAGIIRHFVAVEQDITERKKSEEAMRQRIELQEQFAKVAACVPGVVYSFRLRPDGTACIPFAVPAIEELFAIPRDVLAQDAAPLFENIHPDDRQHAFETIEEASRLPSPWHDVYRYVHPVEGERWIEGWSAPQVEPDGSILWHGFVMDVTARKQVEEEIQSLNVSLERRVAERTAELESMLANATIGLAFFDRDIRFIRINNCLARMNGVPIADHIGRPLREVLPTIADTVEPMLRRVFDTGRPVTEMELEGTIAAHPGERRFWLHSIYPVPGQDGTVISVGAAVTDITEQKRAQEKLAAANAELAGAARLKDEFLASMSHELRTPLNGILGMSEGLQEHVYGPLNLQQLRAVRDVEECGRHLLALINDILDVAKIEAGKVELDLAPVAVEDVCQASLRLVKDSALKKKITVSFHLDKLVRVLTADERRLKQVLVNLLSNAVKFTAEGGRMGLDVVGEGDKGQVRFTVWDTGIGMRPEELQRLFQPFVQLDSRLSRQYEGTGLGLALVKRLTELHGGRVLVESQPGTGSRFTVVLPWTTELPVPVASDSWDGHQQQTGLLENAPEAVGGPLILAVDDNPQNARGMVDYLIFKGFRVECAASGAEAIEMAKQLRPRLILMDIQMREMDGLEAIRRIRLLSGLREVPIVALTALAMAGDRERFLEAGATEYVSKPLSLDQFRRTIEALLNR
jgi:PAS domain S-box-containing protein